MKVWERESDIEKLKKDKREGEKEVREVLKAFKIFRFLTICKQFGTEGNFSNIIILIRYYACI